MKEQMDLVVPREHLAATTTAPLGRWWPSASANPVKLVGNGSNQISLAPPKAGKLPLLHQHLWAASLKSHGIPELNSPLAG